jgi:hypothetical protein
MFIEELKELELEALEERQKELLDELQEVNNELELYEEDYRPDLEDQKETLTNHLRLIKKEIDKRNNDEY